MERHKEKTFCYAYPALKAVGAAVFSVVVCTSCNSPVNISASDSKAGQSVQAESQGSEHGSEQNDLTVIQAGDVCVGKKFFNANGALMDGVKDCTPTDPEIPDPSTIRAGKTVSGVLGTFRPFCGIESVPCGGVEVVETDLNIWRDVTPTGCQFGDECVMYSKVSRLEWSGIPYPLTVSITSGSSLVTVTSGTTAQLRPGMHVMGGVPGNTTIVSVDSETNFTISSPAAANSISGADSGRWPTNTMIFNRMSWSNALAYCANLTWDGKSDWRLPSGPELHEAVAEGIYTSNINNDWIKSNVADSRYNLMNNWFWSATERSASAARWVELHTGTSRADYYDDKTAWLYVICVRDGQ
jgi:hypothetical protein